MRFDELSVGLVPGQGSYRPAAVRTEWESGNPLVREVFNDLDDAAEEHLGRGLTPVVFAENAPTALQLVGIAPELLELMILGQAVSAFRLGRAAGAELSILVGHSFGEISALVCAEAFSVSGGAAIVCHRAAALRESGGRAGAMMALSCGRNRAQELLRFLGVSDVVIAVDNGPHQVVVSGDAAQIQTVGDVAVAAGIGTARIGSPHAYHHPSLARAAGDFAAKAKQVLQSRLAVPVFSAVLGRFYRDSDALSEKIAMHLSTPVDFAHAISTVHSAGARIFVDIGAGSILTDAVRAMHPEVTALQLLGVDGIQTTARFLSATPAHSSVATHPVSEPQTTLTNSSPPAMEVAIPDPVDADLDIESMGKTEVLEKIRRMYAAELDYPEDVLTDDAHFEADLGVDSLKQTELMVRVGSALHIDVSGDDIDINTFDTLGKVADFVIDKLGGHR